MKKTSSILTLDKGGKTETATLIYDIEDVPEPTDEGREVLTPMGTKDGHQLFEFYDEANKSGNDIAESDNFEDALESFIAEPDSLFDESKIDSSPRHEIR
ncbi:uncharacterized protein PAC_04093 [Phialocephala subalpina]|uniref:Uncharacterized protein n=1 Tax=Phialocephala subalpina TaxID=576137 RepID=A0A1L7WN61_9HELO|nr:uncharacterized protein PAC_04093 [Phialocephala subalpina]